MEGGRMSLDVVPFAAAHLDAAAALLAARHRRDRRRARALPARFEEPAAARPLLEEALAEKNAIGAAALRGGRLVGFLLGAPAPVDPTHFFSVFQRPRAGAIPVFGHATVPGEAREVYAALYAVLAARWLASGLDAHYVHIPAGDRAALASWFALGFGHDDTLAVRDMAPVAPLPATMLPVTVRRATTADVVVLADQAVAVLEWLTAPPTCLPPPPDRAKADLQAMIAALLADPALAQWVALRGSEVVGSQLFDASTPYLADLVAPERAIYLLGAYTTPAARGQGVGRALLAESLQWAREAGHAWCALSYIPANPAGSGFWEQHGFQPLVYRLCRQLDERVCHDQTRPRSA
jgi:GNAT superfamily N-acetyltransferase